MALSQLAHARLRARANRSAMGARRGRRIGRERMGVLIGLLGILGASVASAAGGLTTAHAAAGNILIYGPTLWTSTPNEQTLAQAAGYTVTVATTDQWSSMTTAQFAAYNAIVFGDPDCSGDPTILNTAIADQTTWAAAVAGPLVVIGTDPIFHQSMTGSQADQLITNGMEAAASSTKTGLYVDLSCYYASSPANTAVPLLSPFGSFTVEQDITGCDSDINIVAPSSPVVSGITNAGLQGWSCSVHEAFDSFPSGFTTVVVDTDFSPAKPYIITTAGQPSPPTNVTASAVTTNDKGQTTVSVSWGTPLSAGSSPITSYTVQMLASDGTVLGNDTVSSTTFSDTFSLTASCTASDHAAIYANNTSGASGDGASPPFTPVRIPSTPQVVVILAMGARTSLPATEDYDPVDPAIWPNYCGLRSSPNTDMQQFGFYFDPNGSPTPSLTDSLAARGAVILPFSFQRAGFSTPASSSFEVSAYTAADSGTESGVGASALDVEIGETAAVWPKARIYVIGHSEGGLAASDWYVHFYSPSRNPQVMGLFALDAPLNGVQNHDTLCDIGICGLIAPFFNVSPALVDEQRGLWVNRDQNDQNIEAKDSQLGAIFVPIGTPNDIVYDWSDLPDKGILSQYLCAHAQSTGAPCSPEGLDGVTPEPPYPPSGFDMNAHSFLMTQSSIISYLAGSLQFNSFTLGLPGIPPRGTPTPPPDPSLSTSVAAPGQTVTISGSGLGTTAGQVLFATGTAGQSTTGTVTAWSDTSISVTVPASALTGPVQGVTSTGAIFYVGPLVVVGASNGVASISASLSNTAPLWSQPVTVTLTAADSSHAAVANAQITLSSGVGSVSCTSNASGVCSITLAGYGTETFTAWSGSFSTQVSITWTQPPPMTLTLATSGSPAVTGATVSLTATLRDGTGNPVPNQVVSFSSSGSSTVTLSAAQATTNASGVATFTATSSAPGIAQITGVADSNAATATVTAQWSSTVVTGLSPNHGPDAGGTTVTINGTGFASGATAYFGPTAVATTFVNASTLTATAPAGNGSLDVRVALNGSYSALNAADVYTYGPPTVTSISPTSGPLAGGTAVTVTGTDFATGATVSFGTAASPSVSVTSPTSLTAIAPAGAAGTVDVTVSTSAGVSATGAADRFTYTSGAPTVSSLSPTSGPAAGGTTVTVTGTNFTTGATVTLGTAPVSNLSVTSSTSMTFVTPPGSNSQVLHVTTAGGSWPPANTGNPPEFTYVDSLPTVTRVSPSSGPSTAGTAVTVTGTNFSPDATVDFGSALSPSVTFVSATTLTVVSPPVAAGTVHITVSNQAGTSTTSTADQFTYTSTGTAPTVKSLSPTSGPAGGGTVVVISGSGFTAGSTVTFVNKSFIATVTPSSWTATSLTVTTPQGTCAGTVDVVVTTSGGTSKTSKADQYAYAYNALICGNV